MFDLQYYILTRHNEFPRVFKWVSDNQIPCEIHANRLRFRPHTKPLLVEFFLRYADLCPTVETPYPTEF